eukprot:scaffold72123_cov39-Tisochrysis_lutea.AAC.2
MKGGRERGGGRDEVKAVKNDHLRPARLAHGIAAALALSLTLRGPRTPRPAIAATRAQGREP